MVDFVKQRKVRGKPGLVDAHGIPITKAGAAQAPVEMSARERAEAMEVSRIRLAQAVTAFLLLHPGANAVQAVMHKEGVAIQPFMTSASPLAKGGDDDQDSATGGERPVSDGDA